MPLCLVCRYPIPQPLPANLGPNFVGWVSWFTLPTSLIASCMLNEGFWQRVWASADRKTLHRGAGLGFGVVVFVIFLSGFGGWLALAAGLVAETTNPNVYLMQVRALWCAVLSTSCCAVLCCVALCGVVSCGCQSRLRLAGLPGCLRACI